MPINNLSFKIIDRSCKEFPIVENAFLNLIDPIYGSQQNALTKIGEGGDRLCEALFEGEQPKGIIVYKKCLIEGNFELKTLCLLDPKKDSGKGIGTILLERVIDTAQRRQANKIIMSVSSYSGATNFFKKHGFLITHSEKNKYKDGHEEYFLERPANLNLSSKPQEVKNYNTPIYCNLRKQYVQAIATGKKTYEGRVNTEFFSKYQPGAVVVWSSGYNNNVTTEIINRRHFASFDNMLSEIGFKCFVPEAKTLEEAKKIYNAIPNYASKVKKYGAIALELKLLPNIKEHKKSYYHPQYSSNSKTTPKPLLTAFNQKNKNSYLNSNNKLQKTISNTTTKNKTNYDYMQFKK